MSSETWKPDLLIKTGVTLEGLCCARLLAPVVSVKSSKGSPWQELSLFTDRKTETKGSSQSVGRSGRIQNLVKRFQGLCLQLPCCASSHCTSIACAPNFTVPPLPGLSPESGAVRETRHLLERTVVCRTMATSDIQHPAPSHPPLTQPGSQQGEQGDEWSCANLCDFIANYAPILTDEKRGERVKNREMPPPFSQSLDRTQPQENTSLRRTCPQQRTSRGGLGTQDSMAIICPSYKQLAGYMQIR